MTNFIYVRPVKPSDQTKFWEWSQNTPEFDPEVMKYPDTFTLAAIDDTGVLAFWPVQQPVVEKSLMLESLVFKPGITELKKSQVLKQMFVSCVSLGFMKNTGEIYFVGTDERTNHWAEKLGFEKLEYPVYRLRLTDLEHENTY